MPLYEHHVFVCENRRADDDARGCCAARGGGEVRAALKRAAKQAGLSGRVRVNAAGCLDQCEHGPTVVVYPEAVWYGRVTLDDVDEIVREHLLGGRPVERLRLPHMR
jgi:(2Fe-2S) ferredoxin